jgi:hypothetical protein
MLVSCPYFVDRRRCVRLLTILLATLVCLAPNQEARAHPGHGSKVILGVLKE